MTPTTSRKQRTAKLTEKPEAIRTSKRICLAIDRELYQQLIMDKEAYRSYLDDCIRRHPELFPQGIKRGYRLYGFTEESKKMPIRIRRFCLHEGDEGGKPQVFQVVPCFVLPYMTGMVEEVEKPLFLHHKFGVPFWALTYVLGRDDSYWYRISQQLGLPW